MFKINKQRPKQLLSVTITVGIILLISLYLIKNKEIFTDLNNLQLSEIIIVCILQPINVVLYALINQLIINKIGYGISFIDSTLLQFVNSLINRVISEGGAVYRAAYLREKYSISISDFLVSIGGAYIITLIVNSVLGIFFSIVIYSKMRAVNYFILAFLVVILLICLALIIFNPTFRHVNWLTSRVNRILSGWSKIKTDPSMIILLTLITLIIAVLQSLSVKIVFRGLGDDIGLGNSFFYNSITTLVTFINITPGGLGISEGALMFANKVIGLSQAEILLGSLVLRAINFIASSLFGITSIILLHFGLNKKRRF